MLANQFLAGRHSELNGKLAGQKGTFDQHIASAYFEEAKLRNFGADTGRRSSVRSYGGKVIGEAAPGVLHRDHISAPRNEDSR